MPPVNKSSVLLEAVLLFHFWTTLMVRNCDFVLSHSCPPVVSNQDPCSALYSIIKCVFLAGIFSHPSIPLLLSGPSLLQEFSPPLSISQSLLCRHPPANRNMCSYIAPWQRLWLPRTAMSSSSLHTFQSSCHGMSKVLGAVLPQLLWQWVLLFSITWFLLFWILLQIWVLTIP